MGSRSNHRRFAMYRERSSNTWPDYAGYLSVRLDRDGWHYIYHAPPPKPEPPYKEWAKQDLLKPLRNRRTRGYGRDSRPKYLGRPGAVWPRPPRKTTNTGRRRTRRRPRRAV